MSKTLTIALLAALAGAGSPAAFACTNFLITKGASADGSTMITYSADSHEFYGFLAFKPAGKHAPGSKVDVYEWDSGKLLGQIDQVPETYTVVGNMNEHQVAVGETTFGGREELKDPKAIVDYGSLMYLGLQRGKTARETIQVMADLVAKYGYASTGESFSVSDPNEAWIFEMIGKGPGKTGAVWVARRVPDGYVSGHANAARIRTFPRNDPTNVMYAPDVVSFARERGWFDGKDEDFSFADTYNPDQFGNRRFCDGRVWCMFRRSAPSLNIPSAWLKGDETAEPIPLWIKPDKKVTVSDVMSYMRDHFEGTEFDMTKDIGAGPHQLPYRWRPMTWKVDGKEYLHERAVSTQQTGFSFVAQSRSWLPNPIGGLQWFGVDDTFSTVYFPVYAGVTAVSKSFAEGTGSFHQVDMNAAFWIFNQVANFAYLRYDDMIKDIRKVQSELEGKFLGDIPDIDSAALALYKQSPRLAKDYLTQYSSATGDAVVKRWQKLSEFLLYKYMDGNVKDEKGNVTHPDYPEEWYKTVAAATGDRYEVHKVSAEKAAEEEEKKKAKQVGEAILTLLQARGIAVDEESKKKIVEMEKRATLDGWLVKAATAKTVQEALAE